MAQNTKKGFVMYYDYRKHLSILTDEELGKLLMALLDYGETHNEPELDGATLMAFSFIRSQIDRDAEKYARTCQKRSEAGKQGGRPSKANASEGGKEKATAPPKKQTKAKKANAFSEKQNKQTKAKKADTNTNKDTDTNTNTNKDTDTNTNTNKDTDTIIPPNPPRGTHTQESSFSKFWNEYPRKISKKSAKTLWEELQPDAELFERIMQSVKAAKKSVEWTKDNGEFIPSPTKWLKEERWDDELTPLPSNDLDSRGSWIDSYSPDPPPKTAGEDENIRAKAEALKQKITGG